MHKNTKLTPVLRKQIFELWEKGEYSHRALGSLFHVDKRVIGRIIARGKEGDFSVHESINKRFTETEQASKKRVATFKSDVGKSEKKPSKASSRKRSN